MQLTHAWLSDFTDATLSPPLPPLPMSLTSTALFITLNVHAGVWTKQQG